MSQMLINAWLSFQSKYLKESYLDTILIERMPRMHKAIIQLAMGGMFEKDKIEKELSLHNSGTSGFDDFIIIITTFRKQ